jgi:hypothetical protein
VGIAQYSSDFIFALVVSAVLLLTTVMPSGLKDARFS